MCFRRDFWDEVPGSGAACASFGEQLPVLLDQKDFNGNNEEVSAGNNNFKNLVENGEDDGSCLATDVATASSCQWSPSFMFRG